MAPRSFMKIQHLLSIILTIRNIFMSQTTPIWPHAEDADRSEHYLNGPSSVYVQISPDITARIPTLAPAISAGRGLADPQPSLVYALGPRGRVTCAREIARFSPSTSQPKAKIPQFDSILGWSIFAIFYQYFAFFHLLGRLFVIFDGKYQFYLIKTSFAMCFFIFSLTMNFHCLLTRIFKILKCSYCTIVTRLWFVGRQHTSITLYQCLPDIPLAAPCRCSETYRPAPLEGKKRWNFLVLVFN